MKKHKVTIVGGAGFIGSALARHFSRKFRVKILDKNPLQKELEDKVEYQQCDIRNYNEVKQGLEDADLVIHTAIVQIPLINEAKEFGYEVNVLGTQNICKVVEENPSIKGMILASSWHVFGERGLKGTIDEDFGFRPDKVEDRARLYALSKIAQETIVRFYDEMSKKIYGIIRIGTVLGGGMPEKTAANIFITKGTMGEPLTPYKHSMHRPMIYVDMDDVCVAFEAYTSKILNNEIPKEGGSLAHVVNVCYPEPITILELANLVKDLITKYTGGKITPEVKIVDMEQPSLFTARDKEGINIDTDRAVRLLGIKGLTSPQESLSRIIKGMISG